KEMAVRYGDVTRCLAREFGAPDCRPVAFGQLPRWLRADVQRGRADQPVVGRLLRDRSRPADRAARGKRRREHVGWNADAVHHDTGVELNVGVEAATRL